ncbi:MAG: hypothetical protein KDC46_05105 [Thermoleophilia bacterium]|nr:hypothetical protein [Thermoleophilia bacterium]
MLDGTAALIRRADGPNQSLERLVARARSTMDDPVEFTAVRELPSRTAHTAGSAWTASSTTSDRALPLFWQHPPGYGTVHSID